MLEFCKPNLNPIIKEVTLVKKIFHRKPDKPIIGMSTEKEYLVPYVFKAPPGWSKALKNVAHDNEYDSVSDFIRSVIGKNRLFLAELKRLENDQIQTASKT